MKMTLWLVIFSIFLFALKIKSGKIRPNFDEVFGNEWDKNQREEHAIKIEQNDENENMEFIHFGQQMGEEMGTDPIGQMSEYSNQNVIKSDQNTTEKLNDQQKSKIIQKFEAIKEKLKKNEKYQNKDRSKIELKIGKLLGANRQKIYKWKKELNLNQNKKMVKSFYVEKKIEFIERFNEFKSFYGQGKQKEFAKELGISKDTFWRWKKELTPKYNKTKNIYSNEDKLKKMKQYFKIKEGNPKINDELIAKKLEIGSRTLRNWKKKIASM